MPAHLSTMPDLSTPEKIRDILHDRLGQLEPFEECVLLDYPNYLNVGDHLIWLATVFYLTDVLKVKINYIASLDDFSETIMAEKGGNCPIIMQGGGNFGDIWNHHQQFRERIVSQYCDRPIIILPQCIYFANSENLNKSAAIFNAHPSLTLFTRDNYSYELACQHFGNCKIIKAPDMVFHLVGMPLPAFKFNPKSPILYLCREDSELNKTFSTTSLDIPNLIIKDWLDKWVYREMVKDDPAWYWQLPGSVLLFREGWQRGLSDPVQWLSRQRWERFHPYASKINQLPPTFNRLYKSSNYQLSWSLMHSGIYRVMQGNVVITNRLHGHILCLLLGIPHVFLPNSYYKNESFYETWTSQIPYCRFVKEPRQIKSAVQELTSYTF
jgi:pyruvyl transferase EpsO